MKNRALPSLTPIQCEVSSGIKFKPKTNIIADLDCWSGPDILELLDIGDQVVAVNGKRIEDNSIEEMKCISSPGINDLFDSLLVVTVLRNGNVREIQFTLELNTEREKKQELWKLHRDLSESLSKKLWSTGLNFVMNTEDRWRLRLSTSGSPCAAIGKVNLDEYFVESIDGIPIIGKSVMEIFKLERGDSGAACRVVLVHQSLPKDIELSVHRIPLSPEEI